MRILIIQFARDKRKQPLPRFEPDLAVLLAVLKDRGHELSIVGQSHHHPEGVKKALASALPQLIYADISAVCLDVARRSLQFIQEHEFLPVIAGGEFASIDPSTSLSLPGVIAAVVGEPEASLVAYLQRQQDPAFRQVVQGIWTRDETGLARPSLPELIEDLDSLPAAEREMFDYRTQVQSSGEIEIAIGRGCSQSCAYCRNPVEARVQEAGERATRRRSPENILAELESLRRAYGPAARVRFLDHSFALDRDWLASFLRAYGRGSYGAFRCHLRANAVDAELVASLQHAGCAQADVDVISASDFIRNDVFQMELSNDQIEQTFSLLHKARIATRATVYLGAPYESEASLAHTAELLRVLRPSIAEIRPYFPWPGTAPAELARENGWLHPRGPEQLHADAPGLLMPACRPEVIQRFVRELRNEFRDRSNDPWWRRWWYASVNSDRGLVAGSPSRRLQRQNDPEGRT